MPIYDIEVTRTSRVVYRIEADNLNDACMRKCTNADKLVEEIEDEVQNSVTEVEE